MILACFGVSLLLGCLGLPSSRENDKTQSASLGEPSAFSLIASEEQNEDMSRLPSSDPSLSSADTNKAFLPVLPPKIPFIWTIGQMGQKKGEYKSGPNKSADSSSRTFNSGGLLGVGKEKDHKETTIKKLTYESFWTGEKKDATFIGDEYTTYVFDPFVDMPVEKIIAPENVPPNEKVAVNFEITFRYEKKCSELSSIASAWASSYSQELGTSIGVASTLEKVLEFSASAESNTRVGFSDEFHETIKNQSSVKESFEKKISRTFVFDNSNSDFYTKFSPCLRQRFKAYCIEHYHNDYVAGEPSRSGFLGLDKTWEYSTKSRKHETTYFFVPEGDPYFEVSKYRLSSNGLDKNLRPFSCNTIFL